MHTLIRDLLLFAAFAAALTVLASGAAWWMQEPRRLKRAIRRGLGRAPDAQILGGGRGAGLDLASGHVALAFERGGLIVQPLERLQAGELIVDGHVAARAMRSGERRALDQVAAGAREVELRLVFDDPHDPDFQILLWDADQPHRGLGSAAEAIEEARRWIARMDAIVRRPQMTTRPAGPGAVAISSVDDEDG